MVRVVKDNNSKGGAVVVATEKHVFAAIEAWNTL
jgi:hypothetical protein